nr:hypothetical protein [Alistipes onderdonkii]
MIELKLTTGEERLLIPVRNSNGQYELVDNTNTVQMVVVLKNTHIEVIDKCNIDIDAYNKEDLSSRLDLLAVEIIENEQSGIEHNEYEDRIEVKFKCKHDDHILKHENIYYHDHYISLCKSENNEAITAIMQYIEQCESYNFDITNDIVFEQEFPTYNVGFMGIDFPSIKNIGIDKKSK